MPLADVYDLSEQLGAGQYGEVWKGRAKDDGKSKGAQDIVAIKVFKKICRASMVNNELSIMSLINNLKGMSGSNNIVEVFETNLLHTNDRKTLVLEFLSGHELFDRIVDKGHYSERDAAQTIASLAGGLDVLHRNRILHRDLKPENIVYRTSNENADPVIVDFGFGKVASHQTSQGIYYYQDTNATEPLGTHGYISPESYESCVYMDKSDVWALGVILYTVLVGFPPFDSRDRQLSLRTRRGKFYPLSSDPWKDVSNEAKDLVQKLLTIDPEIRLSAAQILEHPWVMRWVEQSDSARGGEYIDRMNKMTSKQKLKKSINAAVASIKFKKAAVTHELRRQSRDSNSSIGTGEIGIVTPASSGELKVSNHQIKQLSSSMKNETITSTGQRKISNPPTITEGVFSVGSSEGSDTDANNTPLFDDITLTKMKGIGLNFDEFCTAVKSIKLDLLAIKPVFDIFDESGDGYVNISEFLVGLSAFRKNATTSSSSSSPRKMGSSFKMSGDSNDETTEEKAKFFFSLFDIDGNGTISKKELYQVIGMLLAEADEDNQFTKKHAKTSNSGREAITIDSSEIQDYLDTDAVPMSDEIDFNSLFQEIDTDNSGEISYDEFLVWFSKGEADGLFNGILDPASQTETNLRAMLPE
jgi:serine/threonine protein kinase